MSERSPEHDPLEQHELHGRSLRAWHTYLTTDHPTGRNVGHLRCPVSRYGRTANDVAYWALAAEIAYSEAAGEPDDPEASFDLLMSLSVNDHPGIEDVVRDAWHVIPEAIREHLEPIDGQAL